MFPAFVAYTKTLTMVIARHFGDATWDPALRLLLLLRVDRFNFRPRNAFRCNALVLIGESKVGRPATCQPRLIRVYEPVGSRWNIGAGKWVRPFGPGALALILVDRTGFSTTLGFGFHAPAGRKARFCTCLTTLPGISIRHAGTFC